MRGFPALTFYGGRGVRLYPNRKCAFFTHDRSIPLLCIPLIRLSGNSGSLCFGDEHTFQQLRRWFFWSKIFSSLFFVNSSWVNFHSLLFTYYITQIKEFMILSENSKIRASLLILDESSLYYGRVGIRSNTIAFIALFPQNSSNFKLFPKKVFSDFALRWLII